MKENIFISTIMTAVLVTVLYLLPKTKVLLLGSPLLSFLLIIAFFLSCMYAGTLKNEEQLHKPFKHNYAGVLSWKLVKFYLVIIVALGIVIKLLNLL